MSQAGIINVAGSGSGPLETLSGENGAHEPPVGGNFNFSGSIAGGSSANGAVLFSSVAAGEMNAAVQVDGTTITINGSNKLTVIGGEWISLSPFIVGTDANSGYSTIAAGYAAAVALGVTPLNVYVKPKIGGGAYTENITLTPGVNLVAFGENPTVIGKFTMTTAGSVNITDFNLQTNSDYIAEITGSAASNLKFLNCNFNISNANGFHLTSSSASSLIEFDYCTGDVSGADTIFVVTGAGSLNFKYCRWTNTAASTTTSTFGSSGECLFRHCYIQSPITTSSTGSIDGAYTGFDLNSFNATPITNNSSASSSFTNCNFNAGSASCLNITAGEVFLNGETVVQSTNSNVITGAGTLFYTSLSYTASGDTINPSTVTPGITQIADLFLGTPLVPNYGGTGVSSVTAYAPICGGTTGTSSFQSAATGIGTSGFVLTSNGSAALPSFQAASGGIASVNVQTFTSSGVYTPTALMLYCTIEVVGGGGGGGGTPNQGGTDNGGAGGGGGGGYARKTVPAATIGASQTVTVGAAGAAGAVGNNAGGTGGTSSLGSIVSATGGVGGSGTAAGSGVVAVGGAGGVGSSGDINSNGTPGGNGFGLFVAGVAALAFGGCGGSSYFGGGAAGQLDVGGTNSGNAGTAYGGGGGGALASGAGQEAGGAGFAGIVVITEYV